METNNQYIEVAVGGVSNRGSICKVNELNKYLQENIELYRSLYRLDESSVEHFKNNATIRSYKGTYQLDRITFDIDKGKNSREKIMTDIRHFLHLLVDRGADSDNMRIWFSGRGFHVEIPDLYGFEVSKDTPEIVKRTISKEFGILADNIYDHARLIRVGYSFNMKSKLYKTPVSWTEVHTLNYEDIKEISKNFGLRKDFELQPLYDAEPIWKSNIVTLDTPIEMKPTKNTSSAEYNGHVTCVQKMSDDVQEGKRHTLLLRMISAWNRKGINRDGCIALASTYVPTLSKHEISRITDNVITAPLKYSCHDMVMVEYCDSKCMFYKRKDYTPDVLTTEDMSNLFSDYMNADFSTTSINLKDIYNINYSYTLYPGELVIVTGDTGLGKTAWIQNMIVQTPLLDCLFLSLEVHSQLLFRRFLQIANNMTKEEVNDLWKNQSNGELKAVQAPINHINVMTNSPEIGSMKQLITELSPKVVVIDTIDAIRVEYNNDPFNKMEKVVNELKHLAVQENVIIIGVSHISKSAAYESRLSVHSLKGNSVIEQKADKVIGIQGDRNAKARVLRSLKARDEEELKMAFEFNWETFRFREVTNA